MQANSVAYIYPVTKPITAKVSVSGSKSFTNRALIIAALANGVSVLHEVSDSNDSEVLIRALQQLGIEIIRDNNTLQIKGNGGKFHPFRGELTAEDSGTAMRFLVALCCIVPGEIVLKGSVRIHQRPVKELTEALIQIGAKISYLENDGFLPVQIHGGNISGGNINIDASVSSQFISALLMIAPVLSKDTEIIMRGEKVSEPYIEMTISVMKQFGISVKKLSASYSINGSQTYKANEYAIEGDASSASYLLAIAALSQSTVEITNVPGNSLQSDSRFADVLQQMGCSVNKTESFITVTGNKILNAIEINMRDMPDTAPTVAVIAAFAKGETIITGLKTLQFKESKRITALQNELLKMGVECKSGDNFIKIKGGNPKGAFINTYNDHRMAMAFAMAGTRISGMSIEAPQVVKKSFPSFWSTLQLMGINVEIR